VAKSAGVSTATLSNHFKGKRDLVVAAYEAETLPFIERTERVITSKENSEEALASFVNELVVLLTVHPALNRAFLPVGREEDPADEVHPVLHRFVTLFGGLLDAYWQEAKFGESDEETAQHLIFALLAWIASFNPPPPVEQSVKNVLASILPTRN
jgi:AcrR family transcriptional regulator